MALKRKEGGKLDGNFVLGLFGGAEVARGGGVDDEHHRQLALFLEHFHKRMPHAGRDVPVDGAHVITGKVLTHLGEFDSLAFEGGMILATEERVHQVSGAQLDAPDLFQDLGLIHGVSHIAGSERRNPFDQGTSIVSKTLRIMSSDVISSASASYVGITLCRSTSIPMVFTSSGVT